MRIFLFVINGLGVGSLPDYSKYDKEFFCTVESLQCIDELSTFEKLGLKKCCLQSSQSSTIGYFFRGRMLTTITSFDSGLNEILGNILFDENIRPKENLLSLVAKHGIDIQFTSSREDSFANVICKNDNEQLEIIQNMQTENDAIFVAEFNDFAKYAFAGDSENMCNSIKMYDKFLGEFMSYLKREDLLFVTGNFGINPTKIGVSREYCPIFIYSKIVSGGKSLKTIQGANLIAMTIADVLKIYPNENSLIDNKLIQRLDNNTRTFSNEILATSFEKIVEISDKLGSKKQQNDGEVKPRISKQKITNRKSYAKKI